MLVLPALHHRPVCSWWRIYQHDCACPLQAEKHAAQNGAANGDVPAADGKGLAPVNTQVEDKTYDSDENDEIRYRIKVEAARGKAFALVWCICVGLGSALLQNTHPSPDALLIQSKVLHPAYFGTGCFGFALADISRSSMFCGGPA